MDQATNAKGVVGSSFTKQHQDAHRSSSSMSNRSNFDVSICISFLLEMFKDITAIIYYFTTVQLNIFFTGINDG